MNWVTHRRLVRVNGLLETSKEHFRKSTMPGTTVASRELVRHAWIFDMLKAEPANMMFTDRGKERGQEGGREGWRERAGREAWNGEALRGSCEKPSAEETPWNL